MIGAFVAWIVVAAWACLLLFRGRFWLIEPPTASPGPVEWPEVVALVPARDEAATVDESVRSLRAQDYRGALHVMVIDDRSSDGTAEIASAAGAEIVAGRALPAGWAGKVWAMAQGIAAAEAAHPEAGLYLFTDADIRHAPDELRRMVARLIADDLALASLMVRLATDNLAERAIVPAFVYFFRLLYPFRRVNDPRDRTAAAAGGYMLARREALAGIGRMDAIKGALIDDCALAAAIKARGGRIRLEMATDTVSLRRYTWMDLWRTIARSAYTELRYSPLLLAGTVFGMALGFLAPPPLAVGGGMARIPSLLAWAMMAVSYLPMLRYYRISPLWAPALPLIALFYLGATLDSARRHWLGRGAEWKGRVDVRGGDAGAA